VGLKIDNVLITFSKKGKLVLLGISLGLVIAGVIGHHFYNYVFQDNLKKSGIVYIPTGANFQQVIDSLDRGGYLYNISSFRWVSARKNFQNKIHSGAYTIKKGWCNNQLIDLLRSGIQTPVKVTLNCIRFREELAAKLAHYLEPDSVAFLNEMNDERFLSDLGFTCETFPMLVIPNTYEIYWDTSPREFLRRMKREFDQFWNGTRLRKAADLGLSPLQVVTIASIVTEETNANDEKSRIAGVYINRLEKGYPLQADPTVKYALGNFHIKRVLKKYLFIDSPYNTYKYSGLPPGPINFPDITSVDAVLNAEHHNLLYFCAKDDFSGYHNFAVSLAEHNLNAIRYQNALNKSKIWR